MKYYCAPTQAALLICQSCGTLSSPDGFLHPHRILDSTVLILIREGRLHVIQDGQAVTVGPGEYIFLFAGLEHLGERPSEGPLLYEWIHFTPPLGTFCTEEALPVQGSSFWIFPEHGWMPPSGRLLRLAGDVRAFLHSQSPVIPDGADYALTLLLMALMQEFSQTGADGHTVPPIVSQVAEWVRSHCHQPLTVSIVSRKFGYHGDYLSTLFRQSLGIPLSQFILRTRMEAAKSLLSEYGVTVREAALSCGFSDEKYFIRQFKKLEGIPPGQYRRLQETVHESSSS